MKQRFNCLTALIFITCLPSIARAQYVRTPEKEKPELILVNKVRPGKLITLNLPAVVKCRMTPHTKKQRYVVKGGMDSILIMQQLRKVGWRKYELDSNTLQIPLSRISQMYIPKWEEKGKKTKALIAFGAGLAIELLTEATTPKNRDSVLYFLTGIYLAEAFYTMGVIYT